MNNPHNPIPYTLTDSALTVFLPEGPRSIDRASAAAAQVLNEVRSTDTNVDRVRDLMTPAAAAQRVLANTGVALVGSTVVYRGRRITNRHLEDRLLDLAAQGMDIEPWKRFVARIEANPSERSRDEIHLFCESGNLPITEDGCILAYKRVNDDYTDCYTRSFDNSVGSVLEMERKDVDDNRNRTCSRGFHFCSQEYLKSFLRGRGRIMVVKVAPEDIVSIPADYNNTKGRTWRYEVVGEIDVTEEDSAEAWGITNHLVSTDYEESFDFGDDEGVCEECGQAMWDDICDLCYDEGYDEDVYEEDEVEVHHDDVVTVRTDAFQAPPAPRVGTWVRRLFGR